MLPGLNLVFYFMFLRTVFKSRRLVKKGLYDDEAWARSSLDILQFTEKCGGRFQIEGLENLKKCQGPVVFVSNHMSTLENMILPFLIAPLLRVTFVVKESLVSNRIFGPIMRSRNPITVSRKNSREDLKKVLDQGQKLISEGISIIIFPQSTRLPQFDPAKFNTLGVKLAAQSGVKVIPIAIKTDFWENGKFIKELGPIHREKTIHIDFGSPLEVQGQGKEAHAAVLDHIMTKLEIWKNETA